MSLAYPVFHWNFEDGVVSGEVIDRSGRGNNGTVTGSWTRCPDQFGRASRGLQNSAATDYITSGASADIASILQGNYTIMFSFVPTTANAAYYLFSTYSGVYPIYADYSAGSLRIRAGSSTLISKTIALNQPYCLVCTITDSMSYIYLNGELIGSSARETYTGTSAQVSIGDFTTNTSNLMKASDLTLWDFAVPSWMARTMSAIGGIV